MKKLEYTKGLWVNELLGILWPLRTTSNSATKETLFTLVFEHEAMILAEIRVSTLRVSRYAAGDNDERLRVELDLIDEIRDEADNLPFSSALSFLISSRS